MVFSFKQARGAWYVAFASDNPKTAEMWEKLHRKRSKAAKKGWETRRKNQRKQAATK